jgi:hypothetical protein
VWAMLSTPIIDSWYVYLIMLWKLKMFKSSYAGSNFSIIHLAKK